MKRNLVKHLLEVTVVVFVLCSSSTVFSAASEVGFLVDTIFLKDKIAQ